MAILTIVETCFWCLASVEVDPSAPYVLISFPHDAQPRSIGHLTCFQNATRKVRDKEWGAFPEPPMEG